MTAYTHLRDYRKSVFLHRFIQCCMKGGLNAPDSLGQTFAAEFCRFFEVCINPETAEPFPLVNSQDERDPPAADKYECFCSCGSQEGKSRECFYPR